MKNKKKSQLKSNCCNAEVRYSDFVPDFIGDDPKTMKIGTCCYICIKCKQACDVHVNKRKTWNINPKTRIVPNKKKNQRSKLAEEEIKIIKNGCQWCQK